jgi:hypothetical protein
MSPFEQLNDDEITQYFLSFAKRPDHFECPSDLNNDEDNVIVNCIRECQQVEGNVTIHE